MGYERFIFWLWESQTTGWHACKVKKHFNFLIISIYFYLILFNDSQTIRSTIRFFQTPPVIGRFNLKQCLWAFKAPKAAPSGKELISIFKVKKINKWVGNMLISHFNVNMKRLGTRFKNDSFQWFRVNSFFWETISPFTHTDFSGKLPVNCRKEIMCEQDLFKNTGKFVLAIYWYEKL